MASRSRSPRRTTAANAALQIVAALAQPEETRRLREQNVRLREENERLRGENNHLHGENVQLSENNRMLTEGVLPWYRETVDRLRGERDRHLREILTAENHRGRASVLQDDCDRLARRVNKLERLVRELQANNAAQ